MKLLNSSFIVTLATLGIAALAPNAARAQTMLYDINSSGGGSAFAGFSGNWGFNFTTTGTTLIGSLGLWDEAANGLVGPHQVGIFNSTGGAALVSATVDNLSTAVASANSGGQWLFTDLGATFSLPAGTYTMGFFNPAAGTDTFRGSATTTAMSGASIGGGKARSGATSFAWPDSNSSANSWYGPNFRTAVPEPGTLALLALGAAGLLVRRRRGK